MSALSLATLGIQCSERAISMASLGVFCGGLVIIEPIPDYPSGGGSSKNIKKHIPGVTSNRNLALREDEELLEMLQSLFSSGYKF